MSARTYTPWAITAGVVPDASDAAEDAVDERAAREEQDLAEDEEYDEILDDEEDYD